MPGEISWLRENLHWLARLGCRARLSARKPTARLASSRLRPVVCGSHLAGAPASLASRLAGLKRGSSRACLSRAGPDPACALAPIKLDGGIYFEAVCVRATKLAVTSQRAQAQWARKVGAHDAAAAATIRLIINNLVRLNPNQFDANAAARFDPARRLATGAQTLPTSRRLTVDVPGAAQ